MQAVARNHNQEDYRSVVGGQLPAGLPNQTFHTGKRHARMPIIFGVRRKTVRHFMSPMTRPKALCAACVCLVLFGCAKKGEQDLAKQINLPSQAARLADLGRSLVARKCPNPISVKSEHIKNKHDPKVTDEIRKITCDGYEIRIYLANFVNPPKELPLTLTIHHKLEHIKPSQYIGGNSAAIVRAYGSPLRIEGEDIVYQLGSEDNEYNIVRFKVKNSLVEEIEWDWDID